MTPEDLISPPGTPVAEEDLTLLEIVLEELKALGGPGSGNFGHSGRPGEVGGSGEGGGITSGNYVLHVSGPKTFADGKAVDLANLFQVMRWENEQREQRRTEKLEKTGGKLDSSEKMSVATRISKSETRVLAAGKAREVAHVIRSDGTVMGEIVGTKQSIPFEGRFAEAIRDPDSNLTIIHSHPFEASLSGPDLWIAGQPGVSSIIAVTHEGSRYTAQVLKPDILKSSYSQSLNAVRRAGGGGIKFADHLVNLKLHSDGVIKYSARFGSGPKALFERTDTSAARKALGL